jgi:hypothetical protein
LPLKDLTQLVRCSRRFNGVARKERSRGLQLECTATLAPVASSALSHHVISLRLEHEHHRNTKALTRDTLQQLRGLPRLTSLQLTLTNNAAVRFLMVGLSRDDAFIELRAVLPTQLRSFIVTAGSWDSPLSEQTAVLASSFWAALGNMTRLTELRVEQHSERNVMHVRPDLAGLAQLRKLTLGPAGERGEFAAELKQLSQLRELTLLDEYPDRIRLLCPPPHALRLETITLLSDRLEVNEETMRALLHLPTLTALRPGRLMADAWPLLPQLPLLRRLYLHPFELLTSERLASLCTSLSHCSSLDHLTLHKCTFCVVDDDDGAPLSAEQQRARWAQLLSSLSHLRRLSIDGSLTNVLPVLPLYLPTLEHLSLSSRCDRGVDVFSTVAHPNVRLLEIGILNVSLPSDEQLRMCMQSERLPKLERCVRGSL